MSQLIDRYLLYRLKIKRDPDAFAKIYDRYVPDIYRFVIFKLPRQEDAQDVTAETFTKFWQTIQQQKDVTNIRAYLYRIARNLVVDFYRNREQSFSLDSVTEQGDLPSNELHDAGRGKDLIEARGDIALVFSQLDRLKEDYRDVLALRLVDALSFADIATVLGKTPGHVRVIYHRGIRALKAMGNEI